jgi:hypothetical protein
VSFDVHDIVRFFNKVDVRDEGECWDWRAGIDAAGYGDAKVRETDRSHGAHRVAYAIFAGISIRDLDRLVIRHSCDRPSCCNPFHLSTGTHADNVIDRVRRGRSAIGIGNGNHKLTEAEVLEIRSSSHPTTYLAAKFGVHVDTIRMAKIGKTWRHLLPPDNDNSPAVTPDPVNTSALSAP